MSKRQQIVGILGFVFVLSMGIENAWADCPTFPTGFTCQCNGDDTKWVCATWSQGADPILDQDFIVDYACDGCSDAPEVKFATADDGWELYSEVISGGAAADLGDILLADDVSPNNGTFAVSIYKSGAGAANVSSIVLDSSDGDWTGHSTLTSAGSITIISGDVTGDITAIEDGFGNGGAAGGLAVISGDVQGTLTIPHVTGSFTISGDLSCGDVETINSGATLKIGSLDGDVCPPPIGLNLLKVTEALAGNLVFMGQLIHGAVIDIADFEGSGQLKSIGIPVYPHINLYNGIDSADARVDISYNGAFIHLYDKDVVGVMNFPWFQGDVFDGGTLSGTVTCGLFPTNPVNVGTLEFASVAAGGQIIADSVGPFQGQVHITGDMAGLIKIENDLEEDEFGSGGEILIDGDLTGWVECNGDLTDTGVITIGAVEGALTGTGKITVDGVCDGDIGVGANTTSNTLIHCKSGLGSTGSIIVNASAGNFNADGSITVGSTSFAPTTGDYDGCIFIQDEAGTGKGGDLNGEIRIALCDDETSSDPGFDHNVCVDGDVNGTIDVVNSSCENQPGYSCYGECVP